MENNQKLRVGILGATGMVGQRFISLLDNHPWFDVMVVAASPSSAGKTYADAVDGRWHMSSQIPSSISQLVVRSVTDDLESIAGDVDMVFSALDMDKETLKQVEIDYATAGVAVVSNNSAHRWTEDVPMIMPEINPEHSKLIEIQRQNRGWTTGLIAVKPNCSIQSYVSVLTALKDFKPVDIGVTSLQAISGAGKTFEMWPEMVDNVIPFIGGEEEKSEKEPLKIWGTIEGSTIKNAASPTINATCIRVPVSDGHMASVWSLFEDMPSKEEFIEAATNYKNPIADLGLPSAPKQLIQYFEQDDRPQTKLDRDYENGMGISLGRLRQVGDNEWQFIALSHNTLRGAAGGAVLMGELLVKQGYITKK